MMMQIPTPEAVQQALDAMERICSLTPTERAAQKLRAAKARLSAASAAVLAGIDGAAQQADAALAEVNQARAEFDAVQAREPPSVGSKPAEIG